MSKVSYANLKLKVDTSINTFDFEGNKIEVLKYLPIEDKYDFTKLNGIGSITAETISNFDYSEIDDVMKYITVKEKVVGGPLANMSFCITGSLKHYSNRDELIKVIEANGGKIAGVNKNLTYLICNDLTSTSGKSKKAKDLGIPVITEDKFMTLI